MLIDVFLGDNLFKKILPTLQIAINDQMDIQLNL